MRKTRVIEQFNSVSAESRYRAQCRYFIIFGYYWFDINKRKRYYKDRQDADEAVRRYVIKNSWK